MIKRRTTDLAVLDHLRIAGDYSDNGLGDDDDDDPKLEVILLSF